MKRKLLTSLLSYAVLTLTTPGFAFACAMPCRMSQKQMADCASRCSSQQQGSSLTAPACVQLHMKAAPHMIAAADAVLLHAPLDAIVASKMMISPVGMFRPASLRPLRGPPDSSLQEFPTAHAPPQLI